MLADIESLIKLGDASSDVNVNYHRGQACTMYIMNKTRDSPERKPPAILARDKGFSSEKPPVYT
jgi:hypothetical protein